MTSPQYMPLIAYPKAWTAGLKGIVKGNAILVDIKKEEDLAAFKGKLKEAIVLVKGEQEVPLGMEADGKRESDEDLKNMTLAQDAGKGYYTPERIAQFIAQRDLQKKISKFLKEENAKIILEPSQGTDGTIFVQGGGEYKIGSPEAMPQVVVSVEQYNRMVRILQKKYSCFP